MSKKPDVAEEVPEPQRKPQAALPPPTDEAKAGEYIPFGEGASTIEVVGTAGRPKARCEKPAPAMAKED